MENIIATFGIDSRLILIQIINFAIVVVALWYFLYTPVLNLLESRAQKIAKGIKDAEEAQKAKDEAVEEKKTIIASANKEAEAMATRAKEYATVKGDELIAQAQKKADQVVKDATLQGDELKATVLKESEAEIARLAILAAEKVLKERAS